MKVLRKKLKRIALSLILVLLVAFSFLLPAVKTASAAETSTSIYTNVMDDLQKDETFDIANYPVIEDDYSLDVIQIAESSDGELFVYVYQPSHPKKDLIATTINISTGTDENLSYVNYKLALLSTLDVFDKYKVEGLTVSNETLRVYDISSIYRMFDISIDDEPDTNVENTILEVSFRVGQCWKFTTNNGETIIKLTETETITVTDMVVGRVRYPDGFYHLAISSAADVHFVAFNTDRNIERLIEADVYYVLEHVLVPGVSPYPTTEHYVYLTDYVRDSIEGIGIGATRTLYNRIEKVSDYLAEIPSDVVLSKGLKDDLKKMSWLLNFAETGYSEREIQFVEYLDYYNVQSVTILRLYFETDGEFYNLGVISNKQSGPDGRNGNEDDDDWWCYLIVGLLLFVILSPWLVPLLKKLFDLLWAGISFVAKIVWTIICTPFKLFGKLFKKKPPSR